MIPTCGRGLSFTVRRHDDTHNNESIQDGTSSCQAGFFEGERTLPAVVEARSSTLLSTASDTIEPVEWRGNMCSDPAHDLARVNALRIKDVSRGELSGNELLPSSWLDRTSKSAETVMPVDVPCNSQKSHSDLGNPSQHPAVQAICEYLHRNGPPGKLYNSGRQAI